MIKCVVTRGWLYRRLGGVGNIGGIEGVEDI